MPSPSRSRFRVTLTNQSPGTDDLLADLRRVARLRRGKPLSFAYYWEHGAHAYHTFTRRFGSWSSALEAAGLPHCIDRGIASRALLDNLATVWRKLGRQPRQQDMVKNNGISRYSSAQYLRAFGSWNRVLLAFAGRNAAPVARRTTRRRRRRHERRHISARLRSRVLIRDNCQCRMCGTSPLKNPAVTLHVDHIVAWSKGGRTVLNNLQTLCARCNVGKGDAS